jgi:hypothetical protein
MTGTRGTRDGRNQWGQGWLEPFGPGMAGTSGTMYDGRNQRYKDGRSFCKEGWQEIVGLGIAETSGTRDGRK